MSADQQKAIDPQHFRNVMGSNPTGVCVITSHSEGARHAMVVGTFTSISLDPPLVGFFPDKSSSSWPLIERTGKFCANVLGSSQLDHCQRFASKGDDKFAGLSHSVSPGGLPLLDDAIAWAECRIASVHEVGDHLLVVGAVQALDRTEDGRPLLFFRGSYHQLQRLERE